jgi:cyclophilin family peptidyl-prolyl cis-trans isomerase
VPSADKRQRQKENARQAREARIAAEKRSRRLKSIRNVGIIAVLFVIMVVVVTLIQGGNDKKKSDSTTSSTTPATTTPTTGAPKTAKLTGFVADPNKTYTAKIDTSEGPIEIKLDPKQAPKASSRFIDLARSGFYNGLTWHRVVKDFVIQSGDPTGTGSGGSGNPPIVDFTGTNHYPIGSVAAAKTNSDPKGTFDSQFFIVTGATGASTPNDYALFGNVTSGIENAQKIEALAPASGDGAPTKDATIKTVTITES